MTKRAIVRFAVLGDLSLLIAFFTPLRDVQAETVDVPCQQDPSRCGVSN
jgi:hypothetical protein